MATTTRLHPVSFKKFVDRLYKDQRLKARTIAELQKLGFCKFAETHFNLITRQKRELATIRDPDLDAVFTNAIVAALHRNGPIELVHEGHPTPNLKVEFYATLFPPEVGVRITC